MSTATVICKIKGDSPIRQEILQQTGEDKTTSPPPIGEVSKCKHLEMLQSVISRMACNSAQLKKWYMLAVSVLGGMYGQIKQNELCYSLAIGAIAFGCMFLDAYYLKLEREFRNTYKNAAEGKVAIFEIKSTPDGTNIFSALISFSVWFFYVVVSAGIVLAIYANKNLF